MDKGTDVKTFDKFDRVYSGHYHTRSDDGKIFYLGNPYEMYWNDISDTRGFHIFDTETLEHTPMIILTKCSIILYYEDTNHQTFDTRKYDDKIVKLIVRKKTDQTSLKDILISCIILMSLNLR